MNDDTVSFAELGAMLGISGERVRQLEGRLRRKLRVALAPLGEAVAESAA